MRALIAIDLDHSDGWTKADIQREPARRDAVAAIKKIISEWRKRGERIIFGVNIEMFDPYKVKFEGCEGCCRSEEERLADFVEHQCGSSLEPIWFRCGGVSAFTIDRIIPYLKKNGITELYLIGCLTFRCVLDVARELLSRGYKVVLLSRGIFPGFERSGDKAIWLTRAIAGRKDRESRITIE